MGNTMGNGSAGTQDRLELIGAPGSPYTRKMLAVLRYKQIPHSVLWGGHRSPREGYPEPKVKLLPTFYFPKDDGGLEAVVDSTPIIRRLEADHPDRAVLPADPALRFLVDFVEDYGDEWLTKAMFHYRWAFEADIANGGPMLIYWTDPSLPDATVNDMGRAIAQRQIDRLYVVGSNETTAATIEESYRRLLKILDRTIQDQGYVFGARPSAADFALYGQLTQLTIADPTPAREALAISPRVRYWIDRVDDLSGLTPSEEEWSSLETAASALKPLFTEIGRVYAPFLIANAQAAMAGEPTFETVIDGRKWEQPTFPYQAKCLAWLREGYGALGAEARGKVDAVLAETGCEILFR